MVDQLPVSVDNIGVSPVTAHPIRELLPLQNPRESAAIPAVVLRRPLRAWGYQLADVP